MPQARHPAAHRASDSYLIRPITLRVPDRGEEHVLTKLHILNLGLIALLGAMLAVHTAGADTGLWPGHTDLAAIGP